ncbi:MAG: O-methyltransferase [Phycisphaerae bacterium]|nr:O-methyltransferase [Phycisphaerae bacterium]
MKMTPERWDATNAYCREVFGRQDDHLAGLMERAARAGLPEIAVSADVGRLLSLFAAITASGRASPRALELGTLAGYSGIWIVRGLGPHGRLITVEPEAKHADFAQHAFEEAGVADRVEIRREKALEALPKLLKEFGPESFDLIFFDAIKTEYVRYFALAHPLLRRGGLLVADNALGSGEWWIDTPPGTNDSRDAVDRFNRLLAEHDGYDAAVLPIREGVAVGRKR